MRHCLSLFVLISLLNLSSVAGRDTGSYDTLKVLCPNDSCKTGITVSELMEYSWDKKHILRNPLARFISLKIYISIM